MSPVRLVTFDVTNTIIRVSGGVGHVYAKVAAMYNTSVDPADLDHSFPKVYRQYITKYPNFGVHDSLTPNKWWNMVVHDTFREAGCTHEKLDKIAQHLYVHFASGQGWEVLPGAVQTLEKLKSTGVKLGVVSNFDERLEKILTHLALLHYFQFVLSSALLKCAKPSSEIFRMATEKGDCKPEEIIHVGDNVITDYEGARAAGMRALLYRDRTKDIPEGVDKANVVFTLADVCKFL